MRCHELWRKEHRDINLAIAHISISGLSKSVLRCYRLVAKAVFVPRWRRDSIRPWGFLVLPEPDLSGADDISIPAGRTTERSWP